MARMEDLERERQEGPAPPAPDREQEAERPQAQDLASAMGNQAVAQVAGSPELQQEAPGRDLMGAQAYTGGSNAFGASAGNELLAHEQAHTVQQGPAAPAAEAEEERE